jgi:DNA-binding NarL/FixJ family response regulator
MKRRARILIVDDHPMMREGLATRIASQSDMEVCGEAADVNEAREMIQAVDTDLAIIDIALKEGHGIDLIKWIKAHCEAVKTLVVSAYPETLYAERSLFAGADGYINKQECQDNVIDAIREVLKGKRYLSSEMTQRLLRRAFGSGSPETSVDPVTTLSDRELEVFQLIGQGLSTAEIAAQLKRSVHTIESHRERIRAKLDLKSAAELIRHAVQWVLQQG